MSQHRAQPMAALSPEYLVALRERDEPVNVADPDVVGPWRIREADGRFHLFREWERFETGAYAGGFLRQSRGRDETVGE